MNGQRSRAVGTGKADTAMVVPHFQPGTPTVMYNYSETAIIRTLIIVTLDCPKTSPGPRIRAYVNIAKHARLRELSIIRNFVPGPSEFVY